MTTTQLSKQDYLKKYLSGGQDKKKKKKKVAQNTKIKSKVIDDDIDFKDLKSVGSDELEIFDLAEEAPQIAGIIDERPEEVRVMSEYKNTKKWRVVADEFGNEDIKITPIVKSDEPNETEQNKNGNENQSVDSSSTNKIKKESETKFKGKKSDPDTKPKQENSDYSPSRKIKKEKSDSDSSPPRKRSTQYDSDYSPPRKPSKRYDPSPKKSKRDYSDSSSSSPRRRRKKSPSYRRSKRERSDSDYSPERKSSRRYDSSPKRYRRDYYSHRSPPRSRRSPGRGRYRQRSPAFHMRDSRRKKSKSPEYELIVGERWSTDKSQNGSVPRQNPPAESAPVDNSKSENASTEKKGLINAEELKKEIEKIKEKEKETKLNTLENKEPPVVRNRATGKKIDPEVQKKKKEKKAKEEAAKSAQYAILGKGIKQVQDSQQKAKDDLYEMSKPLARYADDKDLEEMLKNKEWVGDPMLDYMRKKKKKESDGKGPQKRKYEGQDFPNRYGIKPGYRWDGVDRSNGFEKRFLAEISAKKAREEEAFKWSTSDM